MVIFELVVAYVILWIRFPLLVSYRCHVLCFLLPLCVTIRFYSILFTPLPIQAIKHREETNPLFSFLYTLDSPDHTYYRWRVYANLLGDGPRRWREKPYQLTDRGPFFVPPPQGEISPSRSRSRSRSGSRSRSRVGKDGGREKGRRVSGDRDRDRDRGRGRNRSRSRSRSTSRGRTIDRDRDRHRRRDADDDRDVPERIKYAGMTGAQIERARAQARGRNNTVGAAPLSKEGKQTFESMLQVGGGWVGGYGYGCGCG